MTNTTITTTSTLTENIVNAKNRAATMVGNLAQLASTIKTDTVASSHAALNLAIDGAKDAIKELNELLAHEYYRSFDLPTIIKAGKAVPAFTLDLTEDGVWMLKTETKYPTLTGLVKAEKVSAEFATKVESLRFIGAIIAMGDTKANRDAILSHASKKVAESIPATISNTMAKKAFDEALVELAGKHGSAAMWKDFQALSVRRTGDWGKRAVQNSRLVGDLFLEYANLILTGNRLTVDAKETK